MLKRNRVLPRVKAGDLAPEVAFTRILSAGSDAHWPPSGQVTVIAFFPVTAANLQSVDAWNELVDEFAEKPVQFVWITAEHHPPLDSWLREHPIKGRVFLDGLEATAHAYGMEEPQAVIVGSDGRIAGFDSGMIPEAGTIKAVLDGRPAPLLAEMRVRSWGAVYTPPEPSETVHIAVAKSESGTVGSRGPDHWAALGFTLKGLLMEAYGVYESRVDLAPDLDEATRYDVEFVPPGPVNEEEMVSRVRRAIEEHFHIEVSQRPRSIDVYVLNRTGETIAARPEGASAGWFVMSAPLSAPTKPLTPADFQNGAFPIPIRSLPAIGSGFARSFLPFSGGYVNVLNAESEEECDIEIICYGEHKPEELLRGLREIGIEGKRERREVRMLTVRRSSAAASAE